MIRLPKFFKRDSQSDDLERESVGARRTTKKISSRTPQRSFDIQEEALTEDPEQQRARHRLIGASVLVLLAVVGLPRILDGKPKAVNNDIAVTIVTSLPDSVANTAAPELKTATKVQAPVSSDPSLKEKDSVAIKPAPVAETKVTPAPSKEVALGLAVGEEVVSGSTPKPKPDTSGKTPATGSGKFVLQIGAFASEERAKGWITKMKDQKIPNFVLSKNGTDGTKLSVLRAGPFADKDSAEAAEKKLKAMGLTPRLVEVGSP